MIHRKAKKAAKILKEEGVTTFSIKALQKIEKRKQKKTRRKVKIASLVRYEDVLDAQWSTHPYKYHKTTKKPPYVINWVMSPPGKGSGGHQNIFRFISYLERQGHTCRVYLYTNAKDKPTLKDIHKVLADSYPTTSAEILWHKKTTEDADIIFATGWETAYPVFNDNNKARKFYFVQDFEPYFYPVGSDYMLAENTYKFNFFGITAGNWLATKLTRDYGMQCDNYEFGADSHRYKLLNTKNRKEVFFYARPVTARRGFELGIMALDIFHKKHPDYTITLAGWDVSEYDVPFPYKNLKTLALDELPEVYNECAAALVISLTNMSLLPLELLACGTIPVVTDGENNTMVSNNEFIHYAHPSPDALAEELSQIVEKNDLPMYAEKASASVQENDWEKAGSKMVTIIEREMNG